MRRVILREPQEKGAIAIIVAILFGFGIMFGAAALTIDVGNINADRRQLQNGSDAVALAAAKQCDLTGACPLANDTELQKLADANAADGKTSISRVDGQTPAVCGKGFNLPACPATSILDTGNLQECPTVTLPDKYVRVYTETQNASGKNILPYSFGAAIAGAGSGANQQTCSSVAWGPPTPNTTAPIAISACEWYADTSHGDPSTYAPSPTSATYPQYSPFPDSYEVALLISAPLLPVTDPCYTWRGHDFPGGFGWLDRTAAPDCQANIDPVTMWVGVITGVGGGSAGGCTTTIEGFVGHVVQLPIFDCMSLTDTFCDNTDNGTHSNYHILSTAAFFVTAFDLADVKSSIDSSHPSAAAQAACDAKGGKGSKCMYGWFVKNTGGGKVGPPGTPDFGNHVLQVIG
jgi:Putative Flp pilus-assembly TadE/G-like